MACESGGGISTEPAVLAYAGYEVVAFDISQVAVDYVVSPPATQEQLAGWFWFRAAVAVDTRRALARLAPGEKMYDTFNGSG